MVKEIIKIPVFQEWEQAIICYCFSPRLNRYQRQYIKVFVLENWESEKSHNLFYFEIDSLTGEIAVDWDFYLKEFYC